MIAFVSAIQEELSGLFRDYHFEVADGPEDAALYRGSMPAFGNRRREVLVLLTGVGRARVEAPMSWLLRTQRLHAVVSLGFAGATRPHIGTGTVVLSRKAICLEGAPLEWNPNARGEDIESDPRLVARARETAEVQGIDFVLGSTVTIPMVAKPAGLKLWLGHAFDVASADQESYWVGRAALSAGIPFLNVRVIVDTAETTLPDLVTQIPGTPTGSRVRPALAFALRDPRRIVDIARTGRAAARAARQLAAFAAGFLKIDEDFPNGSMGIAAA